MHLREHPIRKIFNFHGRVSKSEFWLANILILSLTGLMQVLAMIVSRSSNPVNEYLDSFVFYFSILSTWPLLALGSRRLHDIGKSGWWQLIMLTGIGILPLTFWFLKDGDKKPNPYDAHPLQNESDR